MILQQFQIRRGNHCISPLLLSCSAADLKVETAIRGEVGCYLTEHTAVQSFSVDTKRIHAILQKYTMTQIGLIMLPAI
jgi:hypothetical protein